MRQTLITALLLPLAVCVYVSADQYAYKTGIDAVSVGVTVSDRRGKPVADLTQDDFEVREDGVPQKLSYFATGGDDSGLPLHIGLLFDISQSMEKDLGFSQSAAIKFLRSFPSAADFSLVEFGTEVRAARFAPAEFPRLVERIRSRRAKGYTSLYDALGVYLTGAFDQTGRKVLVLYTDGGDTSSSRSWSETVRVLGASDVTVYSIGFMANQSASSRVTQQSRLNEIGEITGGRAFFPTAMKDLDSIYEQIAAEIRGQYTLGYVSSKTAHDGSWRKVNVRLKRPPAPRLTIRARDGYFAPAR